VTGRSRGLAAVFLAAAIGLPGSVGADGESAVQGVNRWWNVGPFSEGGAIQAVAAVTGSDGTSRINVATELGVFRSADSGTSWVPVTQGLTAPRNQFSLSLVAIFAIDPSLPSVVYAAGGDGVFKSEDGGESWRNVSDGLNGQAIGSLVVDPSAPATLYAGSVAYPNGVFKTVDGGEHWFAANMGLGVADGASLAIDPSAPETVYLAGKRGVFKTIDGARSWTFAGTGIDEPEVHFVRLDPSAPSTIYAGTTRVFKSLDGGRTWLRVDHGLPGTQIAALEIDPSSHALLAGVSGIFGHGGGLWRSVDGGISWTQVDAGLAPGGIAAIAFDAGRSHHVVAGLTIYDTLHGPFGGMIESEDFGVNWTRSDVSLRGRTIRTLAPSPAADPVVYAVSDDFVLPREVWRSVDGGMRWTKTLGAGLTDPGIEVLAVHPRDSSIVYAGGTAGIFRTADGGSTWERLAGAPPGGVYSIAIDPTTPTRIFAGGSIGVALSSDSGATWIPLNDGLTGAVLALGIDPRSSALFAGGGGGIFKLSGQSWTNLRSERFEAIESFAFSSGSTVLAGARYVGPTPGSLPPAGWVLRSTDAGATWQSVPNVFGVTAVATDPASPARVYASSWGSGVIRSHDSGATWTPVNAGLTRSYVNVVAVSGSSLVYAGSSAAGVFAARFAGEVRRPVPREIPFRTPSDRSSLRAPGSIASDR